VSRLTNLEVLFCSNNRLTSLDVSKLTKLQDIYCSNNRLTSLDVSRLTNLEILDCSNNLLTSLDVSGCTNLRDLYCSNNSLTSLNLTGLSALKVINCSNQQVNLNLTGSGNAYTANVTFGDGATFSNPALSYSAGVLKSTSNTAKTSTFTSPTGLANRSLSGTLNLTYNSNNAYAASPEDYTSLENPQLKGLEAWVQNGTLHVGGLTAGKPWSVYTISGALVYQKIAMISEETVNLSVRGVYIVKSGNQAIKVRF